MTLSIVHITGTNLLNWIDLGVWLLINISITINMAAIKSGLTCVLHGSPPCPGVETFPSCKAFQNWRQNSFKNSPIQKLPHILDKRIFRTLLKSQANGVDAVVYSNNVVLMLRSCEESSRRPTKMGPNIPNSANFSPDVSKLRENLNLVENCHLFVNLNTSRLLNLTYVGL